MHNICADVEYGWYRSTVVKFSPLFLYPLDATPSDLECLLTPPKFSQPIYLFEAWTDDARILGKMLGSILQEKKNMQPGWELSLRAKLTELYLYLIRRLASDAKPADVKCAVPLSADSTLKLKSAISFMEENYAINISMQEVAERIGMNYYTFSRFFPQMTGKKFNEYLSDIRLSHARKMLLVRGKKVSDVAIECGFDYLSYFISKFRKRYGMTPLDFQRKYRD